MPETEYQCDICGAGVPSALVPLHVLSHRQRGEKARMPSRHPNLQAAVFLVACIVIGVIVALIVSTLL